MKTLQECKDQVAKRHGFDNFEECYFMGLETCTKELIKYCDEAAEMYASQFKERAIKNIKVYYDLIQDKDAKIAELEKANEWISVNEDSPEYMQCVLIVVSGHGFVMEAQYGGGSQFCKSDQWYTATHWKPLPNPPKV